jgi:single-stranded-DNA-specific exonuclease
MLFGRLHDANSMVELLSTDDMGRARILALELEGMNAQRKLLTDQVYQAAQAQLSAEPGLLEEPVLILSHPTWPAGVIGIVASKLVEQYHRPVVLLSAPSGVPARGSARSIEGINITAAIAANQSLLTNFGGHPMAAGLSMDPERIPEFTRAMSRTVRSMGIEIQKEKALQVDGYLTLPQLSLDLVEDFERLAPFGAGNPPLVFATRDLQLTGYAAIGRSGEHMQLTIEDDLGHTQSSIWWQSAGFTLPGTKFDLAYSVRASTYRGQRGVQIEWIDYRLCEEEKISLIDKSPLEVIDLRKEAEPMNRLNQIKQNEQLIVWGEALAQQSIECFDRFSLYPSGSLVIWTIPPGPDEIRSVLEVVKPVRVYLFAVDPGLDQPETFLKRLAGLVKGYLKNTNGIASLNVIASRTAQRVSTIKLGLEWLEGRGHIKILSIDEDEASITAGDKVPKSDSLKRSSHLNSGLAETAAFRRYYRSANKDNLVRFSDES